MIIDNLNRKKGIILILALWIVSIPAIYYFSPIISSYGSVLENNRPAGIHYPERVDRFSGFNELMGMVEEETSIYNVIGNHELKMLDENEEFYNDYKGYLKHVHKPSAAPNSKSPFYWYSWSKNGYNFIVLNTTEHHRTEYFSGGVPKQLFGGFYTVTEDQIEWLERELRGSDRPTVLFCHIPLDDYGWSGYDTISNQDEVREILSTYGNVVGVIQGHSHHPGSPSWDGYVWKEDNIPYFYTPAIGAPLGGPRHSWMTLSPKDNEIRIETEFIETDHFEDAELFRDRVWEFEYSNQSDDDLIPVDTIFDVEEGVNYFRIEDVQANFVKGKILWENHKFIPDGDEPGKMRKTEFDRGESLLFELDLEEDQIVNLGDQENKILKVHDFQTIENNLYIEFFSESELYKSDLYLSGSNGEKHFEKNVKVSIFNDLHYGPKRAELFTIEEVEDVFSAYSVLINESNIDFIVNTGDFIDGQ